MAAKLVTLLITFVMLCLVFQPLNLGIFYVFFRPLLQPYAASHYMLSGSIPLIGTLSVFVCVYSFVITYIRRDYKFIVPNVIPLYLLLFFSVLSFFNTINYFVSISQLLKLLTSVCMYVLIYNSVKRPEDAKRVLYALVLTTIIPMIYGYYQFVTQQGVAAHVGADTIRIGSVLYQPNAYGEFLCIALAAALILILSEKGKRKKVFLSVVVCSIVTSSIIALNRGSWIAMTSALLIASVVYHKKVKIRWIVTSIVVIGIVFSSIIIQRFNELSTTSSWGTSRNTFQGRIEFAQKLVPVALQHVFIGSGLDTTALIAQKKLGKKMEPHNDYLRLAVEIGLPGLILYLFFLSRTFFYFLRQRTKLDKWQYNFPILALSIYWIVLSMVQNLISSVTIFPMFMMCLAAVSKWNVLIDSELSSPQNNFQ